MEVRQLSKASNPLPSRIRSGKFDGCIDPDHRVLLVTHYPPDRKNGSIHHLSAIARKYQAGGAWYSTKAPESSGGVHDLGVPYRHGRLLARPSHARARNIRRYVNLYVLPRFLARDAAVFAREHGTNIVFAQMGKEATVAGREIARLLNVPFVAFVADDPVSILGIGHESKWIVDRQRREFARSMRAASGHGVICEAMGEEYRRMFGIDPTVLYLGVDPDAFFKPRLVDRSSEVIWIGSVGSVVSDRNWHLLMGAVQEINAKLKANRIRVLHIGDLRQDLTFPEVEVTGWVTGSELDSHLSRLDIGFVNLWFEPDYAFFGRTSFPTKMMTYVQTQRPILALGPEDSSVTTFVRAKDCGVSCTSPECGNLAAAIEQLVFTPGVYERAVDGLRILRTEMSSERFYDALDRVIRHARRSPKVN